MPEILYSSRQISSAVGRIFAKQGRRVAIVAFVGRDAADLIPRPKGVEVICWPRAGGTNPEGVRELLRRKAKVWFADSLHMKVYWSENAGCVITSANLSANALDGNLKEAGVLLGPKKVHIDRLLKSIPRQRVTPRRLRQLDLAHDAFVARNPAKGQRRRTPPATSFGQWLKTAYRKTWKLGWFDEFNAISKNVYENLYNRIG